LQELINKIADSYNPAHGLNRAVDTPAGSVGHRLKKVLFTPLLAPIISDRRLAFMLSAFGFSQLLLVATGLTGWQCPLQGALGVICPGCGMTTALTLLLTGQWRLAVHTHAFAPVVLTFLIVIVVSAVLPAPHLHRFAGRVERLERKSGFAVILLMAMLAYWLLRLIEII
jgi:hypothetical protein